MRASERRRCLRMPVSPLRVGQPCSPFATNFPMILGCGVGVELRGGGVREWGGLQWGEANGRVMHVATACRHGGSLSISLQSIMLLLRSTHDLHDAREMPPPSSLFSFAMHLVACNT